MIGTPTEDYLKVCLNSHSFFKEEFTPKIIKTKDGRAMLPGSKSIN